MPLETSWTLFEHGRQHLGTYDLPWRKRDVRLTARIGSLCAAGFLGLNLLLLHSILNLAWAAAVALLLVAMFNLVAAFAEGGSYRSFVASMTDFAMALGAAVVFVLQAGALEVESRALWAGLHLLALIIEFFVIGLNLGASLIGQAIDHAAFKDEKKRD